MTKIDDLELRDDELSAAREEVRRLAYQKWCEAGQPVNDSVAFWTAAEHEWIEHRYVPHRPDID